MAHAEHRHSNPVTLIFDVPVQTVDQVLSNLLSIAEMSKSSVAELDAFISQKTSAVWPHIATSHFSQVSQCFVVCTHMLIFEDGLRVRYVYQLCWCIFGPMGVPQKLFPKTSIRRHEDPICIRQCGSRDL